MAVDYTAGKTPYVHLRGEETSDGKYAGGVIIKDPSTITVRNNRYRTGIVATWPSDDTFSVTFTTVQAVTAYRVLVTGGASGEYVKVAEDATTEAEAEGWLTDPTNSQTADVDHIRVYTSEPIATYGSFQPLWSAWQLFPDGQTLARLDFQASTGSTGPFTIFVEAE